PSPTDASPEQPLDAPRTRPGSPGRVPFPPPVRRHRSRRPPHSPRPAFPEEAPAMRKKLNVKFLGALAGAAAVLGVGVHGLHAYQVRRNASDLLGQATRAEQQGQPEQAAEELGRYLGLVPGDTDALARYGLLLD